MNQRCVEPLNVPGARVSVQDLVGDGGRGKEEGRADADGQGEGAHAEADLVDDGIFPAAITKKLQSFLFNYPI